MRHREIEDEIVEGLCADARPHMLDQHVQSLRRQPPRTAHSFEMLRSVDLDLTVLAGGAGETRLDESHL